ncbi:hypothetical protein [Rhizobium phage RHph_X2_24]|nr:hypothetical protein [Rhizobium phage RHph_X2_24]
MAVSYKIWDFPTLAVQSQLFYAPGAAFNGGFTSGGISILSPEPGGRSFLEVQLSLQVNEWKSPFSSWLMSKVNGDIFRIKLTRTPQIMGDGQGTPIIGTKGIPWGVNGQYPKSPWNNGKNWSGGNTVGTADADALEGSTTLVVDLTGYDQALTYGHVIGHYDNSYMVDDISYNGDIATITVKPPLRRDVNDGDLIKLQPNFLGVISNGQEIRANYERMNNGHIQPGRIVFSEVIL